jgi:hypothetical protein
VLASRSSRALVRLPSHPRASFSLFSRFVLAICDILQQSLVTDETPLPYLEVCQAAGGHFLIQLPARDADPSSRSRYIVRKQVGHLEICACNESSANDLRFCDGGAAF